jgi:hypothetical protein
MTTHTFGSPAPGDAQQASAAVRYLRYFRHWRKGRPFPAGLLIILAGIELWLAPLSSIGTIIHEGIGGISAFFIGALMFMFGVTIWLAPGYRVFAGIASILLGLIALPATNLGGFFLGTLLALAGGALAVAWTPQPGWTAPTRRERRRAKAATPDAAETTAVEATTAELTAVETTGVETTAAQQELAALEERVNEPDPAPTIRRPEVEDTGAHEHSEG